MGVAARARPGDRRRASPASSRPGAAPCRPTTRARPTCRGGHHHPAGGRHGARPHLPGRATRSSTPSPASPTRWPRCSSAAILPDLRARMAEAGEERASSPAASCARGAPASPGWPSRSRTASTRSTRPGDVTLAFLASGIEGIKVRITARARTLERRHARCSTRRRPRCAAPSTTRLGDIVFGVDDESMEVAVAARLVARGLTFGVAESLTGGPHRLAAWSTWPAPRPGSAAASSPTTRRSSSTCSGVPAGPVVTEAAAAAMAEGAAPGHRGRRRPRHHRGGRARRPGGRGARDRLRRPRPARPSRPRPGSCGCPGDRERVRQYGAISALDLLRRALDALPGLSRPAFTGGPQPGHTGRGNRGCDPVRQGGMASEDRQRTPGPGG